jgi:nicotinamide-nucleotide amidase
MNAVILSIGTELTTGQNVDTNAAWLSARLTPMGVRVIRHVTVGDNLEPVREAIGQSLEECDLVVITGGLGPTPDDLTRRAVAEAIRQPLEENADALGQIRSLFQSWGRPMSDANRVQAMIPRNCDVIPNARGTAPGIRYRGEGTQLFALPGVPAEMMAMFDAAVVPALATRTGDGGACDRRLLCFGISEAKVGELLGDLMARDRNPLVGTTASHGVISVRIVAIGQNEAEAAKSAGADSAEIRRRLGHAVFGEGDDSLESVVARLLKERNRTLATAESCTGGLLAKRVTDVPGSSAYFLRGYVTYSNESKSDLVNVPPELIATHGAVSEAVAGAMAAGCRLAAGSGIGLSITGIAGPGGGNPPEKPVGLVYLGLAGETGVETKRLLLGSHLARAEIRDRACSAALNLLRLRLLHGGV